MASGSVSQAVPMPDFGSIQATELPEPAQSFLLILPQPATGTHGVFMFSEPLLTAIFSTNSYTLLLCICYFVLLCATVLLPLVGARRGCGLPSLVEASVSHC